MSVSLGSENPPALAGKSLQLASGPEGREAARNPQLLAGGRSLPILPNLRSILDASPLGREIWLETAYGRPYTNPGFGNAFKDWCREAGLQRCTAHGLRKAGAVRAAGAGASEHELLAMFGWEDAGVARVYTRKAARRSCCNRANCPTHCPPSKKDAESIHCSVNGGHART